MAITYCHPAPLPYRDGETCDRQVISIDIGYVNLTISRLSLLQPLGRTVVEKCVVIDLKDPDGTKDYHTLVRNLNILLSHDMLWMWEPATPIICEDQRFQIVLGRRHKKADDEVDDDEGNTEPLNCVVEAAILRMALDRRIPLLQVNRAGWDYLEECGVDVGAAAISAQLAYTWQARSGKSKTGLNGFHKAERKKMALTVGPQEMLRNGATDSAMWCKALRMATKRAKPCEDFVDSYLQGVCYFHEHTEREQIDSRKAVRATNAHAKREAKAERARVREEAKAKKKPTTGRKRKKADAAIDDPSTRPKKRAKPSPPLIEKKREFIDLANSLEDRWPI